MKKNFLFLLIPFLFVFTNCKSTQKIAQSEQESGPLVVEDTFSQSLIWQISGNGIAQPSYLFGTIHMISENDFFFPVGTKVSFESCEVLALEIDMDNPGEMLKMMLTSTMKGKTLEDLMEAEDYARVKSFFLDTLGVSSAEFTVANKMKPLLASSLMYPKMIEGAVVAYEDRFMKEAKKRDMKVVGLEKVSDQIAAIDAIPVEDQVEMLMIYVDSFDIQVQMFNELIDVYRQQNLPMLSEMLSESEDIGEFEEALLDNRNLDWIPKIDALVREQSTFIAVGAGHLWGEKGVIQLLRDEGFVVRAVKGNK